MNMFHKRTLMLWWIGFCIFIALSTKENDAFMLHPSNNGSGSGSSSSSSSSRNTFDIFRTMTIGRSISKDKFVLHSSKLSLSSSFPLSTTISIDLGPPPALKDLHMHDEPLKAFRNVIHNYNSTTRTDISPDNRGAVHNFTIHRLAHDPDIFLLKNYLTKDECVHITNYAVEQTIMTPAETVTVNDHQSRKFCNVTWIPSSGPLKNVIVANIMTSTAHLLLSKSVFNHPSAGVEDLQVLKYTTGGEFVLHHDGEPRVLTVIYYLNGIAGTWFPLAEMTAEENNHNSTISVEQQFHMARREPWNKQQALDLGKDFVPGKNGLLVQTSTTSGSSSNSSISRDTSDPRQNQHLVMVEPGDTIAFFNYRNDGSGRLNWRALHTGLPTHATEKWIANHWFRVNDLLELQ